jgi:uncharacterized protein YcbK (DUF882 family)
MPPVQRARHGRPAGPRVTQPGSAPRRQRRRSGTSFAVTLVAALGYIAFLRPAEGLDARAARMRAIPLARLAPDALGASGRVRMRFALPGTLVDYPIEVQGDLDSLRYSWVPIDREEPATAEVPLNVGLLAPRDPGFYHLLVESGTARRQVDGLSLAVLVPFARKSGASLNGYRIGYYRGERMRHPDEEAPTGFVEIDTTDLDLLVSDHLRLADFVTRDHQSVWPRYAAVDPRLLDKVELVLEEIAGWYGDSARASVSVDVHSGFRTPLYNQRVPRSARDSRHQFGDAIDLAIDANRDGRLSASDTRLIARAVEAVERAHPDLVGGMGIYTRHGPSYVHIDARGTRVRWRG